MHDLCEGRVCAVTGAGRGVGRAYADALVEAAPNADEQGSIRAERVADGRLTS